MQERAPAREIRGPLWERKKDGKGQDLGRILEGRASKRTHRTTSALLWGMNKGLRGVEAAGKGCSGQGRQGKAWFKGQKVNIRGSKRSLAPIDALRKCLQLVDCSSLFVRYFDLY